MHTRLPPLLLVVASVIHVKPITPEKCYSDKGNKLVRVLLQYFNLCCWNMSHIERSTGSASKDSLGEKSLQAKESSVVRFKDSEREKSITSCRAQFFIRIHVYREQRMKHARRRKIITFKAFFAFMTYNFSIFPQPSRGKFMFFTFFHCRILTKN